MTVRDRELFPNYWSCRELLCEDCECEDSEDSVRLLECSMQHNAVKKERKIKQSSKDVSIDLRLGNLYLFSPITERITLTLFLLQWKVESRVTVVSQTQWLGKCVNRKTSLSLWVWDVVMCLHVFWIETINFTCVAVNFGSQVWTGVTLLKLKALLAYEKLYEEVLLEIPVLPEIHSSFKHKNERYV